MRPAVVASASQCVGLHFAGSQIRVGVGVTDGSQKGGHTSHSPAGESVVAYLTAVLTDLLHTQRDPLALCLLLQAYDTSEPPALPCCHQLSRFRGYYSRWIPEPAREASVSWASLLPRKPGLCLENPEVPSVGHSGCAPAVQLSGCSVSREKLVNLLLSLHKRRRSGGVTAVQLLGWSLDGSVMQGIEFPAGCRAPSSRCRLRGGREVAFSPYRVIWYAWVLAFSGGR